MEHNIKNYNYKSIDESILAPPFKSFCSVLINYIPETISPNVITLVGLCCVIMSTIINMVLIDNVTVVEICVINATMLFLYQIFDTMDGMQGKKVGMYYNPTTELFDHGCDSLVTSLTIYNLLLLSGIIKIYPFLSQFLIVLLMTNFYLPTWEHTNTEIMIFRKGITNPTEALVFGEILYFMIAVCPSLFVNSYVVYSFFVIVVYVTVKHSLTIIKNTIISVKTSRNDFVCTLIPLIASYCQIIFSYLTNKQLYVSNIILPLQIAIIKLIWVEISKTKYNLFYPLLSVLIGTLVQEFGIILLSGIYIYFFVTYNNTMCRVLGMKQFYSIPAKSA